MRTIISGMLASIVAVSLFADDQVEKVKVKADPVIQIAVLLDTSNSMDGLITQAKTQLWDIVNGLATSTRDGKAPILFVSLYEYGNNRLTRESGFIRQVLPLTRDLDQVSQELFALTTSGGKEYCGQVIDRAVASLDWTGSNQDLKMIVIAGNEPFTQGSVDYKDSCKSAIESGILINTIHCGNGIPEGWRHGALLAEGKAMNINQNQVVVTIDAPQDKELALLNEKLNKTFIPYGKKGQAKQKVQWAQDENARNISSSNLAQRAACKVGVFYCPSDWDLVDGLKTGKVKLKDIKPEELPESLRKMKPKEISDYVQKQQKERARISDLITKLSELRKEYVAKEMTKMAKEHKKTLGHAVISAVRDQARSRDFKLK